MKKSIQYLNLIVVFISIILFACEKKDNQKPQPKHATILSSRIDIGGLGDGGLRPNYCKGCNYSDDPMFSCNIYKNCDVSLDDDGDGTCGISNINDISNNYNLDFSIDINLAYSIRDSFLMKSELGQTYHTYYYHLSKIAFDNNIINLNSISNYYQLYNQTLDAIEIIYNGNPNSIPFTNNYKNNALSLINDFRRYNINSETQLILNNIESDLNEFSNIPKYQVLQKLGFN
jgi:hypothetical protein